MADFDFKVNIDDAAQKLGKIRDEVEQRIVNEVRYLSMSTHAFVVNYAQEHLDGWKRDHFLGPSDKPNVRWTEVTPGIWVVEIDESVKWIEEGRQKVFMDWLLNGKSAKTAKDGSRYAVIPFTHARGAGGKKDARPGLAGAIMKELKSRDISLRNIERNEDGTPKLGILHKLSVKEPYKGREFLPGQFSKPRPPEVARDLGLKSHKGIYHLKNAYVTQRETISPSGRKSISKEVLTFRVISSKHQAEGRWYYPEVKPLNSIPEAHKYATAEWEKIMQRLAEEFAAV